MEGVYPVIINGSVCGKLRVEKQGGYMRFVAECPMQSEVIRLSVYGEGDEGYLGVPVPAGDVLRLEKKLSPAAMRSFPKRIDHCALSGEKPDMEEPKQETEQPCEEDAPAPETEVDYTEDEDGPFWYAATDGALISRDGEREMVALPVDDERVPGDIPGQPRIIEGKEYLVYITKEM